VILINLLPHREEKRKRRKAAFFLGLGLAAAVGVVIAAMWYLVLQQMTTNQQERNAFLQAEITKLEIQIKDIASLRAEIDNLKARQKAVEDLQTDRNIPVHVLNELVKQTPEGIYYTAVRQTDQVLLLTGFAQTNERVSELLRNTGNHSEWLTRPELVEIKASGAAHEQRRMYDFSMRVTIKRPAAEPVPVPGAAASAPANPAPKP
jgi:type IV pilus assembly protein PilN